MGCCAIYKCCAPDRVDESSDVFERPTRINTVRIALHEPKRNGGESPPVFHASPDEIEALVTRWIEEEGPGRNAVLFRREERVGGGAKRIYLHCRAVTKVNECAMFCVASRFSSGTARGGYADFLSFFLVSFLQLTGYVVSFFQLIGYADDVWVRLTERREEDQGHADGEKPRPRRGACLVEYQSQQRQGLADFGVNLARARRLLTKLSAAFSG